MIISMVKINGATRKRQNLGTKRLKASPGFVCGNKNDYLKDHPKLGTFTFLPVPVSEIFDIPEGPVIHRHTDLCSPAQLYPTDCSRLVVRSISGKK